MAIEVNIGLVDDEGSPSSTGIWLPNATALADAQTFAQAFASALDDLTGCRVTGIGLVYHVALPGGLKASPVANSDVEQGAKFIYADANNFKTSLRIAGFLKNLITPSSDTVDMTNADVITFNTLMINGQGGVQPSTNRGDDITGLLSAKEAYTRQRK